MEETNNKFLENLEKQGLLYLYLVSLISADSLLSLEDCKVSMDELTWCLSVIDENDISDKEKIREMLLSGKEIVSNEMKNYL